MTSPTNIRNIAIIAHVDHGKTTLVTQLLKQSNITTAVLDKNLEQERGITILAKPTSLSWNDYRINIVDTPGHADFGGEVERVLSMVDSVLLVVDAVEGPMPQTRFVTQKAFAHGLQPIVVINKIDRDGASPSEAIRKVENLFLDLGATIEQCEFPIIYASGYHGYAVHNLEDDKKDLTPLLETIIKEVPPPKTSLDKPFQMQISLLGYSNYVGTIGIGRIHQGSIQVNKSVSVIDTEGKVRSGKVLQLLGYQGLEYYERQEAQAGDIIAVTGIENLSISDTLCDPNHIEALPALTVDEPTVSMTFQANDSPFSGRDGKYVTSRQIRDRLDKELIHDVALQVEDTEDPNKFRIKGRGELHLSILIENMRREGYELGVSKPEVILKEIDGVLHEPYEHLTMNVDAEHEGAVMEMLGTRRAEYIEMHHEASGRVHLEYRISSRALIGFKTQFINATSGFGIMHHAFENYAPANKKNTLSERLQGVLIANQVGKASAFALFNLQARGKLCIGPQTEVYEGMIVGIHSRNNDLVVNVTTGKKLTNVRASGTDEATTLIPPLQFTLEQALEFINNDELVEVTPQHIRIRKKALKEQDRKRSRKD